MTARVTSSASASRGLQADLRPPGRQVRVLPQQVVSSHVECGREGVHVIIRHTMIMDALVSCPQLIPSHRSSSGSGTLAERWNGSKWSIQPTPSPGNEGIPFAAVSCGSATSCTVVGYYDFGDPGFASSTLAEHWDGHSWSSQSLPPAGNPGGDLTSISCGRQACTAAGYYTGQSDEGPGAAPLALRWNGTTWAVQPTPGDATQNEISALTGVSCPSARACTAVGVSDSGGPLVLAWNGTTWHSQAVGSGYALNAVSCRSATACLAIGSSAAEHWNGRRWASQTIHVPPGAHGLSLTAVSCSSASQWTAVGFKNITVSLVNDILTVAEHWNGHSWTLQPTRNP